MMTDAGFMTSRLEEALGWARKYSIFQYPFVTACCGMEYMATACSHYDVDRFGAGLPRFSPRQADVLFVVGTISHKMAPVLKRIYDQMAEPKWVVSFGVCTCTGGFYDNYATVQGIDTVIPVDVYIPGCPPRPESVIDLSGFAALVTSPYYRDTLAFTVWQAALSTLLTIGLALPGAYVFTRFDFPGKSLLLSLATLPFVAIGVAGSLIGVRIRNRIDALTFRAWVKRALFVIALLMMSHVFDPVVPKFGFRTLRGILTFIWLLGMIVLAIMVLRWPGVLYPGPTLPVPGS